MEGEGKPVEVDTDEARRRAEARGLDLVVVAPDNVPPVCKIMDYGSYLYEVKKKAQKQKKASKQTETKTIRLSIRTEIHDLTVKANQARKFLVERHPVKVVVIFRGREMAHKDLGETKMNEFYKQVEDVATLEQAPKQQGFQMVMMLSPGK